VAISRSVSGRPIIESLSPASYDPSLTGRTQSGEDLRIGFAEVLQRVLHGAPTDYLP